MGLWLNTTSDRRVLLNSFYYAPTYSGMLEGRPVKWLNDKIIQDAKTEMSRVWGQRPTYVIPPEIDNSNPDHPTLPRMQCIAWLTSQPMSRENAGSELVLIWFREECFENSLKQIVQEAVNAIIWEEVAGDFEDY